MSTSFQEKARKTELVKKTAIGICMLLIAVPLAFHGWAGFTALLAVAALGTEIEFHKLAKSYGRHNLLVRERSIVYVSLLIASLLYAYSPALALATAFCILGCDICSLGGGLLLGGKIFLTKDGKPVLVSEWSPNKTWEGVAIGITAAAIAYVVTLECMGAQTNMLDWETGIIIAGASIIGDLSESKMKRSLGIKDASSMLGAHGGFFDRLDSISRGYLVSAAIALTSWTFVWLLLWFTSPLR